ncbi:hypothetical protein [Streptomyces sp. NRRL F-2580]|uniref:hypothetical protein n=1 Tax=Streptomyces sp. NRRL F-2580 TaxID=1463841 RepID=UPI0004C5DA82
MPTRSRPIRAGFTRAGISGRADCLVYPSTGPSPLDLLPYTPDGKPVTGTFRLGVSPGMVKHEGTQTVLWAEEQFEKNGGLFNIARNIKNGRPADDDGE